MSEQIMDTNQNSATDAAAKTENQATATKTYTQEEFDKHMAGLKKSLQSKFERQLSELGDIEELKTLKTQAEQKKTEDAIKRGEFEKILQDLAAKKDQEIQKRDSVIKEYKVNTPLLNAAARYRSVNPEQVKALLASNVKLNDAGEVEVIDSTGSVRYDDSGKPLGVDDLVREFLAQNPHFVQATAATSTTKTNIGVNANPNDVRLSQLDLKKPEHRKIYAEARKNGTLKPN